MSTRASRFLYIFLPSLHDYDMKISSFLEDVNKQRRNVLFSELGYGSCEFNPRKVRLHLIR